MNCGLSNLDTLKKWLLPASEQSGSDFDDALQQLGQGIAGMFEGHCNRKFERTVGNTEQFPADRLIHIASRIPLESVASVQTRTDATASWETLTDQPRQIDEDPGILYFGSLLGSQLTQVKITYTGGYWFETLEPTDGGYPTTQPSGSTLIPAALLLAFKQQCAFAWHNREKLGIELEGTPESSALGNIELTDEVKQLLQQFIRY